MTDRLRWPDERLDDFAQMVDRRFRRVEDIPDRITRLEGQLNGVRSDAGECNENVKQLQRAFDERSRERAREAKERRSEHKADRRYWVTTIFGAAALVIGALGVLAGKIG